MSTWNKNDIHLAFVEGQKRGASHMIVAWDSWDNRNYPIYVMPGENPDAKTPKNGDTVDECYRMDLSWDLQSAEFRASHWEWVPLEDPDEIPVKFGRDGEAIR